MKDITIIIPVHEIEDGNKRDVRDAVASATNASNVEGFDVKVMVVGPSKIKEDIMKVAESENKALKFVENNGNTEFAGQINAAVKEVDTDFFSIMECDDAYLPKWFSTAAKYIDANPRFGIYLPVIEVFDYNTPNESEYIPLGYMNELALSSAFANEDKIGKLGIEDLKTYYNFNLTGGIIRTSEFRKSGCMKESMKLSFNYELMLRMVNNGSDIYVIPCIGYFHAVNRKGSLSDTYMNTMSKEEGSFWIDTALEEFKYIKDRGTKYSMEKEHKKAKAEK